MLKPEILEAINKQINAEYYSSYLYLAMAAWLHNENFNGMAQWMKAQAQEEAGHAMKLFDYLVERGGRVTLAAIQAPQAQWNSPLAVFEEVCQHESHVTSLINNLVELSRNQKDFATENFLQWFVKEQVEEEASAADISHKLKMVANSNSGLLFLDHKLGERK